ncbi:30S ribosomal protein S17 [Candidatus Woesearchaeota archaeon]|nr:30S ribosomal protein S17 [Candidatus Woesearchaeota archaeon]
MKHTCNDTHCHVHNKLRTHGRQFTGTVIEATAQKTATIEWQRKYYLPKYERYEQRRTKVKAHNPECLNAQKGDIVTIKECRPLSKTKHFVITEKTGKDITFLEKEHLLEESHVKKTEQHNKTEETNETN